LSDVDLPSTATEQDYRNRVRAAWTRAKTNLQVDVSAVAGEMGVPEHLRGLVTTHVLSRLTDAGAAQGEIRGLVSSMQSTAEYKAALGGNTTGIGGTVHDSGSRLGTASGRPDMSVFGSESFPLSA
jgi:hypothetical protein